jgi:hypothetical protein
MAHFIGAALRERQPERYKWLASQSGCEFFRRHVRSTPLTQLTSVYLPFAAIESAIMEVADLLTRWTIRIALALYVATLLLRLTSSGHMRRLQLARLAWTAGCIAFLIHIACAFHFVHHWSHAAAYADTARQTADVVGWNWGGGLYFNYLFGLVWIADVFWWWVDADSYLTRSRWIEWLVQGSLAFIAFNSTVVFGVGSIRWVGLAATVLLVAVWLGTVRATSARQNEPTMPPIRADESPNR